jgi:hypothetical protein
MAEPGTWAVAPAFWSVDTPDGGSLLLSQCSHPESDAEHPDVPLGMQCEVHNRTLYYCDDLSVVWCDGGDPEYAWHRMRLEPEAD